jgi:hypothetical protein
MLLLRKECQGILDAAGLDELHVQRSNLYKCLSLVGSCGKEIVNIHSMPLNANLKDKERAFAVELFKSFIDKYAKDILDALNTKKAFIKMAEPKKPSWDESNYPQIIIPGFGSVYKNNVKQASEFLKPNIIKEIEKYYESLDKYEAARKECDEKFNKLMSCTI